MTRKKKTVPEAVPEPAPVIPEYKPASLVVQTVGELAHLLEDVFCQLRDQLADQGHPDPHEGAREMMSAAYGLASLSINTATSMRPRSTRLVGFNR